MSTESEVSGPAADLLRSVQEDSGELTRTALASGAPPDSFATDGVPVLCLAAQLGATQALAALLEARAQCTARDAAGFTALHLAAMRGHEEAVQLLIEAGAAVGAIISRLQEATPLHLAAQYGHLAVIDRLVAGGAELEAKRRDGRTALQVAAASGKAPACATLLRLGASPEAADALGHTALMLAVERKQTACVRELLPASDLSQVDGSGASALHVAAARGDAAALALILPRVANVDELTSVTQSGLGGGLVAARPRFGLRRKASALGPPEEPAPRQTALHLAAGRNENAMVEALLARGASVAALDSDGQTALHYAVQHGTGLTTVQLLLAAGAAVDATDHDGFTALHMAAAVGGTAVCAALTAAGASAQARSADGDTPLTLALGRNREGSATQELVSALSGQLVDGAHCDHCGKAESADKPLRSCSCQLAKFCGTACSTAAWQAHRASCRRPSRAAGLAGPVGAAVVAAPSAAASPVPLRGRRSAVQDVPLVLKRVGEEAQE